MENSKYKKENIIMNTLSRDDWVGYLSAGLLSAGGIALMIYIALA